MLQSLKLLLPALVPSWRFFDVITASPRIEFSPLQTAHDIPLNWQEFRPRPVHLSLTGMLTRLFWNARWNESLFVVSCAERLITSPADHSSREILSRIRNDIERNSAGAMTAPYLQFRLILISRKGAELHKEIAFVSPVYRYTDGADS